MTATCKMHLDQDMYAHRRYAHMLSFIFDITADGQGSSDMWIPSHMARMYR